ncbi:MAG TPA: Bax inhibitor-1/YccA family protein [Nocardioides sp.]|nr:Bax inhibitor-1/YccA family protein [Nocardioides sp.]
MQSSNPVFSRAQGFNGRGRASGMTYPGQGAPQTPQYAPPGYPAQPSYGGPQSPTGYDQPTGYDRMTIDSVVQKTGISIGLVVLAAAATWFLTGPIDSDAALGTLYALAMFGALAGFALAMVNSFKKVVSPGLVMAYSVVEGVFVGAFSKALEARFGDGDSGLVVGAVLGTFAAVAGTLAAYKFFNIQVSDKFRKWVVAAMFGFVGVMLLNFVLSFFGADFGFRNYGMMGLVTSLIGLGLGVLLLILDFDFVERGIAAGLPERESWRAAFGLTVTIIWIYIEMLRILAILRGND